MKVYHTLENIPPINRPVLTLGTFDGVHLGHQSILNHLKKTAQRIGGETVVFTFHPHPRIALNPEHHGLELIQPLDERIKKLEAIGIDHLILCPFTKEFSQISATDFVKNILVDKLHIHTMTIGYNHHFGRNREGSMELLRKLSLVYNFTVEEIPALLESEKSVSSTKIRESVKEGDIELANRFLGSPFTFKGTVIEGDKIGTEIGFPTANILIDKIQLMPLKGVFAVRVNLEGKLYEGMMNIGNRPTISNNGERRVEIHLFEFSQNIYGKELVVYLIDRIREEQNFTSINALKEQLKKDESICRHILELHPVSFA